MADKLLFMTTADTEILAAARAVEGLPGGFPEVRCANPTELEDPGRFFDETLEGTRVVMVRLLGGLRAWRQVTPSRRSASVTCATTAQL